MTKVIYFLTALTLSICANAQSKYEQGMSKAMELWQQDKLDEASNLFERIAAAEKDNWLPDYYVGQIAVIKMWNQWETRDESQIKAQADKAQEYVNNIRTIDKDNLYAKQLEAQLLTLWVAHDGMKYGMKYSGKISKNYAEMKIAEPHNPIFILNKADWDMGAAAYFGGDTAAICNEMKRAIDLFATFKPETQFHPSYGLERAEKAYAECSKK